MRKLILAAAAVAATSLLFATAADAYWPYCHWVYDVFYGWNLVCF